MEKVTLKDKFALFDEFWSPKIVGELNGQHVKLAKAKGEFDWHRHDSEDEMFLVIHGRMNIELRDRSIELAAGEFLIVPRGIEHRPTADEECHVLVFEPVGTLNTGNVRTEKTVDAPERL